MSKYIIDIPDNVKKIVCFHVGNANAVWTTSNDLDDLELLTADYINEHFGDLQDTAYKKGLHDGESKCRYCNEYQQGLDDAWEVAKKVVLNPDEGGLSILELNEIFNCATIQQVFRKYTLSEVIAKLKAYEKKQKTDENVKRGDVVRHKINGLTYIVTLASDCGYVLLGDDGNFATSCITNTFEKTGKHFDIDKILEGLRYDD